MTLWRLPIPFCLPLFGPGLLIGLLAAAVGAFLPWIIPVAAFAAMVVSPRLADWTDIVGARGATFFIRMSAAESIARRFRNVTRLRVSVGELASVVTIFLVGGLVLAVLALMPGAAVEGVARWAQATWYWDLCYVHGLRLAEDMHLVGYPDVFRPVVGELGLMWPPLCAFAAAAMAVALPLWLGAMARGFEAGQGAPTWRRFLAALLPSLVAVPLAATTAFTTLTGLGPQPAIGDLVLPWLILPVLWSLAIARLANVGTLLAALLSRRRRAIEW
ncbi:MAG: hypothetical protein NVV74_02155 [Magnetospirillum sp.]|nr:hypothetical protein [Magnetospirillum sp.]